jgi:hypothetical protein
MSQAEEDSEAGRKPRSSIKNVLKGASHLSRFFQKEVRLSGAAQRSEKGSVHFWGILEWSDLLLDGKEKRASAFGCTKSALAPFEICPF